MGMSLHGNDPVIHKKMENFPVLHKYSKIKWHELSEALDKDKKLSKQYYEESNDYDIANPGVHFQNNVWLWRPLWHYCYENCKDILSKDDYEGGKYNDGHIINKDAALKIGEKLKELIENGQTEEYSKEYKKETKQIIEKNGKDSIYASYIFSIENVKIFSKFCMESGGFSIF